MTAGTHGPSDPPRQPPPGHVWPLPLITVPVDKRLFRLTRTEYPDPAYFGRTVTYRFDALDRSFGVCYLGTTLDCCFLEVLSTQWRGGKPGTRRATTRAWSISKRKLTHYYAAIITPRRPLRLAYLADDGLAQLGIDQRVTGGDDYTLSGSWSMAIHAHVGHVDGIFYATRHHNLEYAVALFERASAAVSFERWGTLGHRRVRDL